MQYLYMNMYVYVQYIKDPKTAHLWLQMHIIYNVYVCRNCIKLMKLCARAYAYVIRECARGVCSVSIS